MKEKLNILLIGHDADLVTRKTFAALTRRGMNVTLAKNESDKADSQGLDTIVIPTIKSKFNTGAIKAIRHIIKGRNIDVIFCASTSALSNALLANVFTKAKVIGYRGTQAKVRQLDPTYRMALLNPRVAHIVCETKDIEEYLTRYIKPTKLSTYPKPYSLDWVKDATPADPESDRNIINLSYVGVTEGRPHKGLNILIEAIKILNDKCKKCKLTVVGRASQTDINTAPENIIFTGNRPDAVNYIKGTCIFVLPSLRDASPRVIREAQAVGVPCIVSDIPGARDLIVTDKDKESGVLVEPGNPRAVADAIVTLAEDKERLQRMSANAIINIRDNYDFDKYVDYFDRTIRTVAQGKHN